MSDTVNGPEIYMSKQRSFGYNFFSKDIVWRMLKKTDPRVAIHNPVMLIVEIGSIIVTISFIISLFDKEISGSGAVFTGLVAIWLWFTLFFSYYSEALAENRGKAQADELRRMRATTSANKVNSSYVLSKGISPGENEVVKCSSAELRKGDLFFVKAGESIPNDGEIVVGIASVDESAITGESSPVIREAGSDFNTVTGGTKVLSDWIVVKVTSDPGEGFIDKMINLVESAERKKTPNEIALNTLLMALTAIFLVICIALIPYSMYAVETADQGKVISISVVTALFVCLAPTTISGLLNAIGIAGMDRLMKKNVIATSGQAIEAAGDVDVLLLDKTGTITHGNRHAVAIYPADGIDEMELANVAFLSSLADDTPEGRSIITLLSKEYGIKESDLKEDRMEFIPFTAQTRVSGVDIGKTTIRKGAGDAIEKIVAANGNIMPDSIRVRVRSIAETGGTPLVICKDGSAIGTIYLKDVIKPGIKVRFAQLRKMGITTVMVTGDNKITAAAVAAEAGVDDYLAEATPENKIEVIKKYQAEGKTVAMTGDGTNDAPALAQADVAVAMNSGTQAAKEAANMIDLDSDPTKLIEIVETGKQLLTTRGALTAFSITNDLAKYFAIIPAAFISIYPALGKLNFMGLENAVLSAVIFNALIIVALIPLALHGVKYRPMPAEKMFRRNLLIYGLGGLVVPFIFIKLIDMLISTMGVFV
ncbi:MAG: potassium-transporting ATPase subunit KdpB [Candidatus Methanogranum gryphiswaldense]|nr:MAG: potassium-transporting ATPase subunit KdpB [Candidatus Methanogranum sp. U3.2.1]